MAAAIFWESHVCCGFNMKYRRFGLCQAKDVLEYFLNWHYSVMCVNSINALWLKHDAKMQSFAYWVFHWDHRVMAMAPKGGGFSIWKSIRPFFSISLVMYNISVREVRKSTFFLVSIFLVGMILFVLAWFGPNSSRNSHRFVTVPTLFQWSFAHVGLTVWGNWESRLKYTTHK